MPILELVPFLLRLYSSGFTSVDWAIGIVALYLLYSYITSPTVKYPPGPKPDPIIGNLRQIPTQEQPKGFAKLSQQYGELVFLQLLGKKILITDSLEVARDLLEKRGAVYSDRPRFVLLAELMGWGNVLTHMEYGPQFRRQRRFIQESFHQRAVRVFYPTLERESDKVLHRLIDKPADFAQHIKRFAASSIMQIAYGHTVESDDDIFVTLVNRAATATVESSSGMGSSVVDIYPPLKHLPSWMLPSKRAALIIKKDIEAMLSAPFEMVKEQMRKGIGNHSFTRELLESHTTGPDASVSKQDEEDIMAAAGVLYAAAADTTTCYLMTFVLAMTRYPEIYRKAQQEMDRVIGRGRLPTIDDRESLPYLTCLYNEVFRWNCPVPLGIPHRLMRDDFYRSWVIPKGTMVIANIWAMTQKCEKPEEFIPERYLDEQLAKDLDPQNFVFGFGRRVCPGKYLAQASIWLVMAKIIATMDIRPALGANGKEQVPPPAFSDSFVRHPAKFMCSFKPRAGVNTKDF